VSEDRQDSGRGERGTLRGGSFEGQDFDGHDLRGADFTGANLRSTRFGGAKLGVPPRAGALILVAAILVSVGAGVVIGSVVRNLGQDVTDDRWDRVAEGGTIGLVLAFLVALILWRGIDTAFQVAVVLYFSLLVLNVIANAIWDEVEYSRIIQATAVVIFLVLAVSAGILGRVVGGVFGSWSIALVAVLGGLASGRAQGGLVGIVVAVFLVFISKRALRGDPRDRTLRRVAHRLVRRLGTQFVDADLTGADFTGADVRGCDVRGATLTDVTWDPEYPQPVDLHDSGGRPS
jgi:hypothetical protein